MVLSVKSKEYIKEEIVTSYMYVYAGNNHLNRE